MKQTEWKVEGMSCGHCVMTIKKSLKDLAEDVQVDLAGKKVSFKHSDNADLQKMQSAIEDAGFQVIQ